MLRSDEVIIFCNLPNPSSPSMDLGFAQFLIEINCKEIFLGVNHGRRLKLTTSNYESIFYKMWNFRYLKPYRPPRPITGIAVHYLYSVQKDITDICYDENSHDSGV
jgi:hypothetical protein